ncbi:probable ubiquitin-like-specific protease 2B [Daucus carota subsp. sativus]|uniref:probable ubiquitin-like-specific protease 2B n=1 Tax=Daucus carota subsp. sativus TaxID=79200 RepID=UPI00308284B3
MRLILKIIPEERKTGCSFFDPMFFISYMDAVKKAKKKDCTAIEKSNVWKWIKKQKIFACRYVFVPICQSNHWNLLILCNLGEDLEMNEKSPCMLLLDSLHEAEPKNLEPCIKQFVYQMYKNESVQGTDDVFQFDLSIPMVPQQDDGEKCGYYVLYYMFKFLMSCPENFNINEHGGFMNSSWFTEEEMNNFFNNLSSEKLHTDQMQASEDIIVVKEKNLSSNMEVDGQNVDNEIAKRLRWWYNVNLFVH